MGLTAATLLAVAVAAAGVLWTRAGSTTAAVPQDRLGPVLLVPGRIADSDDLVDLQRRLYLSGRRALIVSVGTDVTGDLRRQARQVEETARGLVADGAPSVDVVGYGAGGIVTRIWLADGGADVARRVITLGSPHQGVAAEKLDSLVEERFCAVTCPQLTAGSPLLRALPATSGRMPWTNITTARDRVVPAPAAVLPGALNVSLQSICTDDRSGHRGLTTDPLAVGVILRALAPEPLTATPTAADCADLRDSGSPEVLPAAAG